MWTRTRIYSGEILEEIFTYSSRKGRKVVRSGNGSETCASQKLINERMSKKQLARLVNANFQKGDLWVTLTYAPPAPEWKTALRRARVFLSRLRKLRAELGLPPLKYIGVTTQGSEWDKHRIHHHFILPYMPDAVDVLSKLWRWGTVQVEKLSDDAEHEWLAGYVFENSRGQRGKRWTQSRNLARPVVEEKTGVRGPRLDHPPKEKKGYFLVRHYPTPTPAGFTLYAMYKRVDGKPNRPKNKSTYPPSREGSEPQGREAQRAHG